MKTRRIILLILIIMSVQSAVNAKSTYIPTYFSQVNVEGEGRVFADSTRQRELTIYAPDGRYSLTVMHDSVTQERIKAIKRKKLTDGLNVAGNILSGISAYLLPIRSSWELVRYLSLFKDIASMSMFNIASKNAEDTQRVNVSIVVENLSDKEMVVNDMTRGLTWYIPSRNYVELKVGNPEINRLRIACSDPNDQRRDYVTVQAANYLENQTIAYEDDKQWIYPVYESVKIADNIPGVNKLGLQHDKLSHYEAKDKHTFKTHTISIDSYNKHIKKKK